MGEPSGGGRRSSGDETKEGGGRAGRLNGKDPCMSVCLRVCLCVFEQLA